LQSLLVASLVGVPATVAVVREERLLDVTLVAGELVI
jgi:ABC-type proline/glycine betaine transport system permease subunit